MGDDCQVFREDDALTIGREFGPSPTIRRPDRAPRTRREGRRDWEKCDGVCAGPGREWIAPRPTRPGPRGRTNPRPRPDATPPALEQVVPVHRERDPRD